FLLKLISHIEPPIQLLAQGIKKTVIIKFHQFGHEFFLSYGEVYIGIHGGRSRIQRDKKLLASSLDLKAYDAVVGHYHRPDVQVVRTDRRNDKILGCW